jgi:hypothetical protein
MPHARKRVQGVRCQQGGQVLEHRKTDLEIELTF